MGRKYIFTDKHHSYCGIMSSVLGLIDITSIIMAVYVSYLAGGQATSRYGSACILAFVFAGIGLILGYIAKNESQKFYLFAYLGIVLNLLAITGVCILLGAGAYL